MSATEERWWLGCRASDNIVVNLPNVEDASLAAAHGTTISTGGGYWTPGGCSAAVIEVLQPPPRS
jgi:hypothetical protein